jgi:hypothetical protein
LSSGDTQNLFLLNDLFSVQDILSCSVKFWQQF